jgi:hypothetical protein
VAAALVSAALTGADSNIVHAAARAVIVTSLEDLVDTLLESIDFLMVFIKIVTLFI